MNKSTNSAAIAQAIVAICGFQSLLHLVANLKTHLKSGHELEAWLAMLTTAITAASEFRADAFSEYDASEASPIDAKACETFAKAIMAQLSAYLGNGKNGKTDMGIMLKSAFNRRRIAFKYDAFILVDIKETAKSFDWMAYFREQYGIKDLTKDDAMALVAADAARYRAANAPTAMTA